MTGNNLKPNKGARQQLRRVCRGGKLGKTGGRGYNGQGSRSGGGKGPGFEGGQTPWFRRLPKYRGFRNPFRTEFEEISLAQLNQFDNGTHVTPELLVEHKVVRSLRKPIKVLGNGELSKKLTVALHAFTGPAREAIEGAGGKTEVI
ncbi:MAG: 50S ribosomal protein L15 [Vulcanimicrobiota bacterium]|nr:50S ribosomal protein L15 [Candidatus Eremiobacteraeota bacterium]